ncbi:transglutaminase-like domain-containing protein [Kribbella sp. NBC_01245]|uniref:transglutaminase-like domain-containing protein n=1 Tax=Kribbella sp. NBC_01245 TaxID=2903578 RepID=UPI002E2A2B4E|nr:transglutaminase-like domain-containing protein [Kribbella sp. NBC_01245]
MPTLDDYARQSVYSDPGPYVGLIDALPSDLPGIGEVVRNTLIHYRGGGIEFTGDRLAEIDNRWIDTLLTVDQNRNGCELAVPRESFDRVVGCCRDYTLLTVSALRHKGIPARSRIGFATYFAPDFNHDHVVTEYWNGSRWVWADTQLDPAGDWSFDPLDLPPGVMLSAAQVWTDYRKGLIDPDLYGATDDLKGPWFIRDYVYLELAHRMRDELLLWDIWGEMSADLPEDLTPTDTLATLLLAADTADTADADATLTALYVPPLRPTATIQTLSPTGHHRPTPLRTPSSLR